MLVDKTVDVNVSWEKSKACALAFNDFLWQGLKKNLFQEIGSLLLSQESAQTKILGNHIVEHREQEFLVYSRIMINT